MYFIATILSVLMEKLRALWGLLTEDPDLVRGMEEPGNSWIWRRKPRGSQILCEEFGPLSKDKLKATVKLKQGDNMINFVFTHTILVAI